MLNSIPSVKRNYGSVSLPRLECKIVLFVYLFRPHCCQILAKSLYILSINLLQVGHWIIKGMPESIPPITNTNEHRPKLHIEAELY